MNAKYIKWGIIALVILIPLLFVGCSYNGLVDKRAEVEKAWSNVESQYQRRADLIPNLVATVKGYASHEQKTFIETVEARAMATAPRINFDELTDENLAKFQNASGELSQALGRLMAIGESYPDLKASTNFLQLQDEVAGAENRVNEGRIKFNDAVKNYNVSVQKFPGNIVASMFGFTTKSSFAADAGAEKAPKIDFAN